MSSILEGKMEDSNIVRLSSDTSDPSKDRRINEGEYIQCVTACALRANLLERSELLKFGSLILFSEF